MFASILATKNTCAIFYKNSFLLKFNLKLEFVLKRFFKKIQIVGKIKNFFYIWMLLTRKELIFYLLETYYRNHLKDTNCNHGYRRRTTER